MCAGGICKNGDKKTLEVMCQLAGHRTNTQWHTQDNGRKTKRTEKLDPTRKSQVYSFNPS